MIAAVLAELCFMHCTENSKMMDNFQEIKSYLQFISHIQTFFNLHYKQFLTIFHVFFRGKYVEAEYECQHNYKLEPEKTVRLVCVEHKWQGKPPKCVPLSNSSISTSSSCMCDQLCTVVGNQLVCSCFRGFRQQGTACHGMYVGVCSAHTGQCCIESLDCVLYKRGCN